MSRTNALQFHRNGSRPMSSVPGAENSSRAAARGAWWRTGLDLCRPYEWVTLAYLGLSGLFLAIFHGNLPGAWIHFLIRCGIAGAIFALVWAAWRWPSAGLRFARHWYPLALFIFFFEELHYLCHLIFAQWFDAWLIEFDFALFRAHPTVWLEQFATPARNDLMAFFYLTYYFYTVVLAGLLYGKRQWRAFWVLMTATAVAYAMGYVIAILFPVEGPYHTLAAMQRGGLEGGPATALMNVIQRFGRVHGAAFPSLHVAGAFVAVLGAWRYARRMFWVFLPLFMAMCVSTVYGRYHYVADIFGGLIIGGMGWLLGRRWEAREAEEVEEVDEVEDSEAAAASRRRLFR